MDITNRNAINWFEIPVSDFDRAKRFYEAIFRYTMPEDTVGAHRMGYLLFDQPGGRVGGAIVQGNGYVPVAEGCVIYLNANPSLSGVLDRVPEAGGQVLVPAFEIAPGLGYCAFILDSEGNRIGLHAGNLI